MLAANVVGQEVFGLEDGATESALEALHQVLVLLLNAFVEVTCTVAVQRRQRFRLSLADFTLEAEVAPGTISTASPLLEVGRVPGTAE